MLENKTMIITNFATYSSANGGGKRLDVTWQEACDMFRFPKSSLSIPYMREDDSDEYKEWKKEVDKAKHDAGYVFWGETLNGRKRKQDIVNHCAVALDYDDIQDKTFVPKMNCNYMLYSTTKHVADDPHYRLIVPLSRPVSGDEYQYITRRVIEQAGADGIDKCVFDDSRAMGYTVALKDSNYVYVAVTDKGNLDVDAYLVDGWKDVSTWYMLPNEKAVIKTSKTRSAANNNRLDTFVASADIRGYAGAMCRAYGMSAGIEHFLKDVYTHAYENRYTYVGASGVGGLVVLDNNRAISYHSTDPANDGKPHNLYELVQIHCDYNKKQMNELCKADAKIMAEYKGIVAPDIDIPDCAAAWGDFNLYPVSDYGIALRLRDLYASRAAWATDAKTWMMYDGVKWDDVDLSDMYTLFPRVADIMRVLATKTKNGDDIDKISSIITQCESSRYRENILKAFKALVQVKRGEMDSNIFGMNTTRGYLKLEQCDGQYLMPNSHSQHCCKQAGGGFGGDFAMDAECLAFIEGIFPDEEVRLWMQKFLGYCMTGSTREKLAVFCHAEGNNGKTVFLNLLKNAFKDYCETGDDKLITTSRFTGEVNGNTPTLASLAGARICLFDEIKAGKRIESAAWKRMTGGSPMKACKKYQNPFNFTPQFKMIIACNDVPVVEDAHDPAMKIRIRIVPFQAVFTAENADKTIETKIETESWCNTFLAWCYEGLQYYLADGLDNYSIGMDVMDSNMPAQMKIEFRNYFGDADEIGDFVKTYCEITHNDNDFVPFAILYDYYVKENKSGYTDSKRAFSGKLKKYMKAQGCKEDRHFWEMKDMGRTMQRGYSGIRFYKGITYEDVWAKRVS